MKRYKSLYEDIKIPLEPGQEFLWGKWKNKRAIFQKMGTNEKGEPVIITATGKIVPLLKIRLINK